MVSASRAGPTLQELIAQLNALPESQKGETIDGELFVQPRPRFATRASGASSPVT